MRLVLLSLLLVLAGCQATASHQASQPKIPTFYNHWELFAIDAVKVPKLKPAQLLNVDRNYMVSGMAGCNRVFGQGKFEAGVLTFENLSTTMKICPAELDRYEQSITEVLSNDPKVTMYRGDLVLRANHRVLQYRLVKETSSQ